MSTSVSCRGSFFDDLFNHGDPLALMEQDENISKWKHRHDCSAFARKIHGLIDEKNGASIEDDDPPVEKAPEPETT